MKRYLTGMESYLLCTALAIFSLVLSCNSEKRIAKRQDRHEAKFDKLKRKCDADSALKIVPPRWATKNYPPKLRIVPGKPVIVQSKPIIKRGKTITVKANCDSAFNEGVASVLIDCPPTDTVYNNTTTTVHDTVYQADSAALTVLRLELRAATKSAEKQKDIAGKYRISAVTYKAVTFCLVGALLLLVLALILWKWYKGKVNALKVLK